jgi:hypothetical protein
VILASEHLDLQFALGADVVARAAGDGDGDFVSPKGRVKTCPLGDDRAVGEDVGPGAFVPFANPGADTESLIRADHLGVGLVIEVVAEDPTSPTLSPLAPTSNSVGLACSITVKRCPMTPSRSLAAAGAVSGGSGSAAMRLHR